LRAGVIGNTCASGAQIRGSSPWPAVGGQDPPLSGSSCSAGPVDARRGSGEVPSWILATLRGRMRRLRHLMVLAVAVGAGTVLSACGGDSSPETPIVVPTETTQGSLGKTEFIAQADSACAEANSSIEQFAAAGQGESEAAQIAQLRQGVIDQIKQLGPPSEDSATLDQFLKAMSDEVSAGQKIGLAVQRGEDPS